MKMKSWPALMLAGLLAGQAGLTQAAQAAKSALPSPRASEVQVQIPSHGVLLNGFVYVAGGPGPHPLVVLLDGFPGNERNLDVAQDMRRAGWDVLYFNYRGSWGTHGDFSMAHSIEDTAAAVDFLRQPEWVQKLRLDPARIVLVGHSMGGFLAIQQAAADPAIKHIVLISAADMAGAIPFWAQGSSTAAAIKQLSAALASEGMAPLAGCTADGLAQELADHVDQWAFSARVDALKDIHALVITSEDGFAPASDAFVGALRKKGAKGITTLHLDADHVYSDRRLELSKAVVDWLKALPAK